MIHHVSYWLKKGGFAAVDQGLFSAANFLVNILLARWLEPVQYGAFVTVMGDHWEFGRWNVLATAGYWTGFLCVPAFLTKRLTSVLIVFATSYWITAAIGWKQLKWLMNSKKLISSL
jgi:hypothetical protein